MNPINSLDIKGMTTHPREVISGPKCFGVAMCTILTITLIVLGIFNLLSSNYLSSNKLVGQILVPIGAVGIIFCAIGIRHLCSKMQEAKTTVREYADKELVQHLDDIVLQQDEKLPTCYRIVRQTLNGPVQLNAVAVLSKNEGTDNSTHNFHVFSDKKDVDSYIDELHQQETNKGL